MSVYYVFIISESGSLRFFYDHNNPNVSVEKTYDYPLPFRLRNTAGRTVIDFGASGDLRNGYAVLNVNGVGAEGTLLVDGRDIMDANYPVTISFGIPRLSPNDRITLAGMFQGLHGMSRVLSPVANQSSSGSGGGTGVWNSGMQSLEMPSCRIHCFESRVGVKFLMLTDSKLPNASREALRRIYEAYTDYVLKNPFCDPNQAINKLGFFTSHVQSICEQIERGIYSAS